MNKPNPIMNLIERFDQLPLLKRIVVKGAFRKMIRHSAKSSEAYQKYLGGYTAGFIRKILPELKLPEAINTTYFVRPGVPVSLLVNPEYLDHFKINDGPYYHHGLAPYRFLLRQYYKID